MEGIAEKGLAGASGVYNQTDLISIGRIQAEIEQGIRNDDDADVRNAAMEVYRFLEKEVFPRLRPAAGEQP